MTSDGPGYSPEAYGIQLWGGWLGGPLQIDFGYPGGGAPSAVGDPTAPRSYNPAPPQRPAVPPMSEQQRLDLAAKNKSAADAAAAGQGLFTWLFDHSGYEKIADQQRKANEAFSAAITVKVGGPFGENYSDLYKDAATRGTSTDRLLLSQAIVGDQEDAARTRLQVVKGTAVLIETGLRATPGGNTAIQINDQGVAAISAGDVASDGVNAFFTFGGPAVAGKLARAAFAGRSLEEAGAVGKAAQGALDCGSEIKCFVGGTPVLLGDGKTLVPIEDIHVGERVATDGGVANSADGKTASADPDSTEVDPKTWRLVTITCGDEQVQTLQPESWIESHGLVGGSKIDLNDIVDIKEMGTYVGEIGTVDSITACPTIQGGSGRVVLTTINHLNDNVFNVTLVDTSGASDTLGVSGYHKIYTEDRGWVNAESLTQGEQVRGDHGDLTVATVIRDPGTFRVYNMTVESDHVYFVGNLSALVHNTCYVYRAFDADGKVVYVGITNDIERRAAQQALERGIEIERIEEIEAFSRDAARGVEQALIEKYGLSNLLNKINSIAATNPKYASAVALGKVVVSLLDL